MQDDPTQPLPPPQPQKQPPKQIFGLSAALPGVYATPASAQAPAESPALPPLPPTPPVLGRDMMGAFTPPDTGGLAQNTPKAGDIYNPNSDLMQQLDNPLGAPTATPTPTPPPKKGWDYFRSLFGLA